MPTGAGPQGIGWKADGRRALVVGRAIGTPLFASVVDYRPGISTAYSDADLVDARIVNFGFPPFAGTSNVTLLDAAWRPGLCDEGLITGTDPGTILSPDFAPLIRFVDSSDPACLP